MPPKAWKNERRGRPSVNLAGATGEVGEIAGWLGTVGRFGETNFSYEGYRVVRFPNATNFVDLFPAAVIPHRVGT